MDNYDKSVYEKARNTETAIRQLKSKNKSRIGQVRNRAKIIAKKILNRYPQKYQCINYTNYFDIYSVDFDSIPVLEPDINFEGDFISINTYSFGQGQMIPLFWFPSNFLWDELF